MVTTGRFFNRLANCLMYLVFWCLLILVCSLSITSVPVPLASGFISNHVTALYQAASIWVPHFEIDNGQLRNQHKPLFEKVEQDLPLSEIECENYRKLYQDLLLKNQHRFGQLDTQLSVVENLAMTEKNNVGGFGVEGKHDHHDLSSRNNFTEIHKSVHYLQQNSHNKDWIFSLSRVEQALSIYKNLNDVLFHLGTVPHTKSVAHIPLDVDAGEPMQKLFESMLFHFKQAQFLVINSPEYREQLKLALDEYQQLVEMNQRIVHENLSSLELKLVGNWGGWRSLTPDVSDLPGNH